MKLFLISQDVNDDYDTYDSAVVAAENEEQARRTHPNGDKYDEVKGFGVGCYTWAKWEKDVKVSYIGQADVPAGVICASYNAG